MPPNQRSSARQEQDQHAFGGTIRAMGRRHDGLRHPLGRVNGIGLHQDSRYRRPTGKDGNLLTVLEGYRLAGIGPALHSTGPLQAWHPGQHSHRSRHPVYKPDSGPGYDFT